MIFYGLDGLENNDDITFDREEHYRLALESVVRWTDKRFDSDSGIRHANLLKAVARVAETALESCPDA